MSAERRRHRISQILRAEGATSQEALVEALGVEGLQATQATVSRDLRAIGAVKTRAGYRLPDDLVRPDASPAGDPDTRLRGVLREHARDISPAASLVVIRTAPGHGGVIADAIDRVAPAGIVGTIAGDDTIFVATPSNAAASRLARRLLAGLEQRGATG